MSRSPPPQRHAAGPVTYRGPASGASESRAADESARPETARGRGAELDPSQRVQVAVRIRPHNKADGDCLDNPVHRRAGFESSVEASGKDARPRSWAYDAVFDEKCQQRDVFESVGRPFVADAFEGYNGCIFAYGQTGSGKTHSMFGDLDSDEESWGLLPRVVKSILDECQRRQVETSSLSCKVQVSFLEIYNEKIHDLLHPPPGATAREIQSGAKSLPEVKLVEDKKGRWVAKDIHRPSVMSVRAVMQLIKDGNEYRQRSSTHMNEVSSRSHSVFSLVLKQTHDPPSALLRDKECTISVVDLAGSERQSKTLLTEAKHLREAEKINLSLLTLGMCLNACSTGGKEIIPVRNSVLTRLLADIFGGNSKAFMFATVSPSSANLPESISTLQFAANAKLIKHNAKVNTTARQLEIKELKDQIDALNKAITQASEKAKRDREVDLKTIEMLDREKDALHTRLAAERDRFSRVRERLRVLQEENLALGGKGGKPLPRDLGPGHSRGNSVSEQAGRSGSTTPGRPTRARPPKVGQTAAAGLLSSARADTSRPLPSARVVLGDDEASDDDDEGARSARDAGLASVRAELAAKLQTAAPTPSAPATARSAWTLQNETVDSMRYGSIVTVVPRVHATDAYKSFVGHSAAVYSCSFSRDGERFVSASRDRTLRVWRLDGTEVATMKGHNGFALSCDFSPSGQLVASASDDKTVRLWEADTGKKVHTLRGHNDRVYCCQFSPSGNEIASASCDKSIKVWDVREAKKIVTLRGHTSAVFCVHFSPDGNRLCSASDDKSLRVWRWKSQEELNVLFGHTGTVWSCRFHPDGKHVVSASMDETIKLWNVDQSSSLRTFKGHSAPVHHAAFARGGQLLVSASRDRTLRVWNVDEGRCIQSLVGHTNTVYHCSIHGNVVLSCASDDVIKLYKLP